MASILDMQFDGGMRLSRTLQKLHARGAFRKKELTKVLRPSAKVYQQKARALVPVDTGALRRSIKITTLRGPTPVLVVAPQYETRLGKDGTIKSSGLHAHLVEFGTAPRKLKKPRAVPLFGGGGFVTITHTGSMPAQPFLRPAWRATRTRMTRMARLNLGRLAQQKVRRAGP